MTRTGSLEDRLAAWEARNLAASLAEVHNSDWGVNPRHVARASLWWLFGVAWIAVDAITSGERDSVWFVPALAVFAVGYAGAVFLPGRPGLRPMAYAVSAAVCVAGPVLSAQHRNLGYLCVISAMAAVIGFPLGRPARLALLTVLTWSAACTARFGFGAAFDAVTSALLGGVVMYSLHALTALLVFLRAAREDRARAAVAAERLRFARDLHDLLGHSLSMIVVQAEVARRLAERDPAAAARAATDIETVGRGALAEIRQAVTGYRENSLSDELAVARESLRAAGVSLTVERWVQDLPPQLESVLAWALREATTNVVRHSGAHTCAVDLVTTDDEVRLCVSDDGRGAPAAPTPAPGHGLTGLRERAREVGGTLHTTTATAPPGFTVTVTLPRRAS